MLKKLVVLLLMLTLAASARADVFTLNQGEDEYDWMNLNVQWQAETFETDVPDVLQEALDGRVGRIDIEQY